MNRRRRPGGTPRGDGELSALVCNEPVCDYPRTQIMRADPFNASQQIATPSVKDCRKLELVRMMAGSNELAAEELKLLLKLQRPEVLGGRRGLR